MLLLGIQATFTAPTVYRVEKLHNENNILCSAVGQKAFNHPEISQMKHSTIAVIGAGNVGSTTAYALLLSNVTGEVILVDIDEERCKGEVLDLSDALPFCEASKVRTGTTKDAAQADIIVITAGTPQVPGQARTELVEKNAQIVSTIINQMKPINPHAIMIIVSNPVDVMTLCAQKFSGLPKDQVFGSGTLLDTQRLRGSVAKLIGFAEQSIHAYIIGEHGDTQLPVWSSAYAGGMPLTRFPQLTSEKLDEIAKWTRKKAYEIIECKHATFYGIATCVAAICETIIFDQKRILPLSTYVEAYDVAFSMPVVLGEHGIEQQLSIPLSSNEKEKLEKSAEHLREIRALCPTLNRQ